MDASQPGGGEHAVLVTRSGPRQGRDRLRFASAVGFVVLILFAQLFLRFHRDWGMPWEWEPAEVVALFSRIAGTGVNGLALLVIAGIPLVAWLAHRSVQQRVVVDAAGVSFSSRLPGFLKPFFPDWKLRWNEIDSVSIGRRHPVAKDVPLSLMFRSGDTNREVSLVLGWGEEGKQAPARKRKAFYLSMRDHLRDATADNAMIGALRRFGVNIEDAVALREDPLRKHPLGVVLAALAIAAFCYGCAERVFLAETYASTAPWWEIGGLALLGCGLGTVAASRMQLPRPESLLLLVMLGAAVGFAAYPGMLRLNMLMGDTDLRVERFRQAEDLRLVPLDPALPVIREPRYDRYWLEFETGTIHEIAIRKGGLGFYQYDRARIRENIRNLESSR